MIQIAYIRRYPIKGLPGEDLDQVTLVAGEGIPLDRRYALAAGDGRLLSLTGETALARLAATATADEHFSLYRDGQPIAEGRADGPSGFMELQAAIAAHLGLAGGAGVRMIPIAESGKADETKPVSLINLATLEELALLLGAAPDLRRFRANLYLDGVPAWQELDWIGRELRIGRARLRVTEPTGRCKMINVDPERAVADLNIPMAMVKALGHALCGVYAAVIAAGRVAPGDAAALS